MIQDYIKQFELAELIAEEAHKGQIRKFGNDKGKPYIVHPKRVANKLEPYFLKTISILHDVAEDTPIGFKELKERGICAEVITILSFVTKNHGENYLDFIKRIMTNEWAVRVKIADLQDNLESCPEGQMKDKYRLALFILTELTYDVGY